MFSQNFAQYVLNKGLLTPLQVQEALKQERSVRVKLGILAINSGFMTAGQVEEVHSLQRTIDKRFGEIALDKGYLTVEKLNDLLEAQESRHLNFGQVVVDKGFMTLEQLQSVLEDYKHANRLSQLDSPPEYVRSQLDFLQESDGLEIYCDYTALFLRAMTRFLGAEPLIIPQAVVKDANSRWLITQSITGDITLHTGYYAEDAVLLKLARAYSGEDLPELDDLAVDSAAEFLNVANGLFCINLSNVGLDLDLQAPKAEEGADFLKPERCCVPIDTEFGTVYLLMTVAR
jgi:hypothetical protein